MSKSKYLNDTEKAMIMEVVEVFAENIQDTLQEQLVKLKGQIQVSDSMGEPDRKNYYIGAFDQLSGMGKVVELNLNQIKESIQDGEK